MELDGSNLRRAAPWRLPPPPESTERSSTGGASGSRKLQRNGTGGDATRKGDDDEEEEKGKRKTRRGGRRRRTKRDPEAPEMKLGAVGKDAGLRSLLGTLCRLVLQTSQNTRLLMGVFQDTYMIPASNSIVAKLTAEGRGIAAEAEKRRKSVGKDGKVEPLGPPAPAMFLALLESLETANIGSGNLDRIKDLATRMTALDLDEACEKIYAVKVSRTRTEGTARLTVAMERGPDRKIVIDALKALSGVTHKQGVAPAGYLEEELMEWVAALDQ